MGQGVCSLVLLFIKEQTSPRNDLKGQTPPVEKNVFDMHFEVLCQGPLANIDG